MLLGEILRTEVTFHKSVKLGKQRTLPRIRILFTLNPYRSLPRINVRRSSCLANAVTGEGSYVEALFCPADERINEDEVLLSLFLPSVIANDDDDDDDDDNGIDTDDDGDGGGIDDDVSFTFNFLTVPIILIINYQ